MIMELKINYTDVSIKEMLNSISVICKARMCKVGKKLETSIYDYLDTSCTTYELLLLGKSCSDKDIQRSTFEVGRSYINSKYFTVDTAFPLFRGLFCYREKFVASSCKTKQVKQHELSLYKEFFKVIYYLERKMDQYDEKAVKSLYTDFEWHIVLPELVTSLVLGILTHTEEERLLNLLRRDKVAAILVDKFTDLCKLNMAIEIKPILEDFNPIIIKSPSVFKILREYVSMMFSVLLCQCIKKLKSSQLNINVRTISDFRLIFELEENYDYLDLEITFDKNFNPPTVFKFQSEVSTDIVKKYFKEEGVKVGC